MQNSWMKIVIGRIINMLAVLILLFGHVSSANATSFKQLKSDKSLKFYKLDLIDDENSFLEDEEEERYVDENLDPKLNSDNIDFAEKIYEISTQGENHFQTPSSFYEHYNWNQIIARSISLLPN